MNHRVSFKWEWSFGHIVQMVTILGSLVGLYFGLVSGIDKNRENIEDNTKAITQNAKSIDAIRETRKQMIKDWQEEANRREERQLDMIREIKENVNWLVRREADK